MMVVMVMCLMLVVMSWWQVVVAIVIQHFRRSHVMHGLLVHHRHFLLFLLATVSHESLDPDSLSMDMMSDDRVWWTGWWSDGSMLFT